jgi:hypothetical protein
LAELEKQNQTEITNGSAEKIHRLQGLPERKELLDAAVQHAASVHGHENTSELREQIKSMLKDERD